MMKIIISLILFSFVSLQANAGFNGLTYHSRANCGGFNESITWDARWYRTYSTISDHFYSGVVIHELQPGWEETWRSAAYHATEGYGGWRVVGTHWMIDEVSGKPLFVGGTNVTDCSIYDGWWDSN